MLPEPVRALARPVRNLLRRLDHVAYRWLVRRVSSRPPLPADPRAIHFFVGCLKTGGTERQIVALVKGLTTRGFRCKVWVVDDVNGPLVDEVRGCGATVEGIFAGLRPIEEVSDGIYRVLVPPAVALARGLRWDRPRVLQSFHEETNIIGALAGRLAGVPVVVLGLRGVHPRDPGWAGEAHWSSPYDLLDVRSVDALIVNSEAGRHSFSCFEPSFPSQKVKVVYNALVPPSRIGNPSSRRLQGPPIVLWMGRVSPEKRPDIFVAVLARLRELAVPFEAWVAGDGKLLASMIALADREGLSGQIRFLGDVLHVGDLLDAASVLLLCSDVEGLPNSILEAHSCGCPVVATAVGGVPELIVNGVSGFLAPRGDVASLAARLSEVLANPELALRFAAAGRESSLRGFSVDRMVEGTLRVYSDAEPITKGQAAEAGPRR